MVKECSGPSFRRASFPAEYQVGLTVGRVAGGKIFICGPSVRGGRSHCGPSVRGGAPHLWVECQGGGRSHCGLSVRAGRSYCGPSVCGGSSLIFRASSTARMMAVMSVLVDLPVSSCSWSLAREASPRTSSGGMEEGGESRLY